MQDRTFVFGICYNGCSLDLRLTIKISRISDFRKNMAILVKSGLFSQKHCQELFQGARQTLHVKSWIMMD